MMIVIFLNVGIQLPSCNSANLSDPKTDESRIENWQLNRKTVPGFFLRYGLSGQLMSRQDSG
jgi:hypothetical protein